MPKSRRPNFIREWRQYRGISQEELAHQAGMTAGNLSQIENGRISYTHDSLGRIAKVLDCTRGDLLERDPSTIDEFDRLSESLSPAQRRRIAELAKVMLKPEDS